MISKII